MTNKAIIEEKEEIAHLEAIPDETVSSYMRKPDGEVSEEEIDFPAHANASVSAQPVNQDALISDEQYLGILNEIASNIRDDRKQVSDYLDNFADMVINEGDATTSSKETLVNLVKTKVDLQDKMLKVADLMTRLKLKNTYAYSGPNLNAVQQNNFNIGSDTTNFSRKELIKAINNAKKKKDQ
jgi:hypothetical protein